MGTDNERIQDQGQKFFANAKLQWEVLEKKATDSAHGIQEWTRHSLAVAPVQIKKGWEGLIQRLQGELGFARGEDLRTVTERVDALSQLVADLSAQVAELQAMKTEPAKEHNGGKEAHKEHTATKEHNGGKGHKREKATE